MDSQRYFESSQHCLKPEPDPALVERLEVLLGEPGARSILESDPAGLRILASKPWRTSDAARAVCLLENALAAERPPLVIVPFVDTEDASRHPGFDDVHEEIESEEAYMIELRRRSGVVKP